jgi:hypothetical protein
MTTDNYWEFWRIERDLNRIQIRSRISNLRILKTILSPPIAVTKAVTGNPRENETSPEPTRQSMRDANRSRTHHDDGHAGDSNSGADQIPGRRSISVDEP